MRVEVLAIGDELLDGRVADTNTLRLAEALSGVGVKITQRTTITDDKEVIVREARAIAARGTALCVVSGGLGPTTDDVTSEAFADLLGVELIRDQAQARAIQARIERLGREMTAIITHIDASYPRTAYGARLCASDNPGLTINPTAAEVEATRAQGLPDFYMAVSGKDTVIHAGQIVRFAV